jgi:putative spermidine/putrescine transport system ATP-binding protein
MPAETRVGVGVRLARLSKCFGAVVALDNVSLDVAAGEFLTLLGPSGSGKTTTMHIVAGFESATSGEVSIGGRPVAHVPPHRRDVGLVFQNYALFPHMTAADNIAFPLSMRKTPRAEVGRLVERALDLVRLGGLGARYPRQLSGGQQQRVALARVLVFNPRVVLMDEPLGALDKKLREDMQLEIKHIQQRLGLTVIYVTHDQEEALVMSDRIAVMRVGRLEQVGSPDDLYERPASRFVAEFIGESNVLAGTVTAAASADTALALAGGATVRGPAVPGARPGDGAMLVVRPERMLFIDDAPEGWNRLAGTVDEVIYVGETTKYVVTAGEETLRVKQQNRVGVPRYKVGDRVSIGWTVAEGSILPLEGS